jgi:hypothetical protein
MSASRHDAVLTVDEPGIGLALLAAEGAAWIDHSTSESFFVAA